MKFTNYWIFSFVLMGMFIMSCEKEGIMFDTKYPSDNNGPKQYGTPFDQVPASADVVMYEVNLSAFSDAGNLNGVTIGLDSIKALGVNVVWLMPIYPIGELNGFGSPYAIRDYTSIKESYGNLEDLRALVDKAHSLDMAVMLDWVANHTAWDHPWMSDKSYYTQDASGNIVSPMNWSDVADLNFTNQNMRKEMIAAMKYWILEANVDGYRCDFAEGVPHDFWEVAIDTLRNIPNRDLLLFAEAADKTLLNVGFDLFFGWSFYGKLYEVFNNNTSVNQLVSSNTNDYFGVNNGDVIRWISNHDDNANSGTPITIFKSKEGSLAAFVLSTCMGGAILIYNGQEVACPTQLSFFEGGNTKINWNINPVIKQAYKEILAFNNQSTAIRDGSFESLSSDSNVIAFKRKAGSEEVLVFVNVRGGDRSLSLADSVKNTNWINALSGESVSLSETLSLGAYEYLVLRK